MSETTPGTAEAVQLFLRAAYPQIDDDVAGAVAQVALFSLHRAITQMEPSLRDSCAALIVRDIDACYLAVAVACETAMVAVALAAKSGAGRAGMDPLVVQEAIWNQVAVDLERKPLE